jgi:Flp pilus assembly protein TadB
LQRRAVSLRHCPIVTRRRNLLGRFLQWNLGPVILCVGTLILLLTGMARSVGKPGAALPFTTLAVIWLVAVFVIRSRNQRELKQELDQLNQIERLGKEVKSA